MKIISLFTIITMALMATSCSASVCFTVDVEDNFSGSVPDTATLSPPAGTTDIECVATCTSATSIALAISVGDTAVASTNDCGTTISYTTSTTVSIRYGGQDNLNMVVTCSCNNLSTPVPSSAPSSAPVPSPPTPSPPASSCFSKEATVKVKQPGQVPVPTKMTQVEIGDMVLTASNRYQPIYAFAHNDATTDTEFLQIHTASGKNPLEVTGQHLVYVQGKDTPVTAKSIKVGDSLSQAKAGHGQGERGAAIVTKIDSVQRHGIYAPLTPDGTLVVDGIASSCYISLQLNGNPQTMELQGHSALSMLSHHRVAHMLLTLPRLVCMGGINPQWCQTYNNDGVAVFVQMAFDLSDWFHAQHWAVQWFLLAVYLVVLCPLYALELLLGAKLAAALVVGGLVFVGSFVRGNAPAMDPGDLVKKET